MSTTDEEYLVQFREAAAQKAEVAFIIANLRRICETLQAWQKTAADIASPTSDTSRPQWSKDRLPDLAKLRALLVEYHRQIDRLRIAWRSIRPEKQTGLAPPETLEQE